MQSQKEQQEEYSFYSLFYPLTTKKAITIFIILGIIVFFNSLFNSFLGDDFIQVVDNTLVHSFLGIWRSFIGGTFDSGGSLIGIYYRPLLSVFYTLLYISFGSNPFFFHLFQVLLHIGSTILIFLIFKRFIKQSIAFLMSLIFLVHPLNVEAVVYIADLQDILFMFFGLLGIYLLIIKQKTLGIVYICFLFSLLSKETGALFLIISWFYIIFLKRENITKHIYFSVFVCALYLFLRFFVARIGFGVTPLVPIAQAPLQMRLMNIPLIISYYINNFFYPATIISFQSWMITSKNFLNFYFPLLVIIIYFLGVAIFILWIQKEHKSQFKPLLFFTIWFLIGMSLNLQIFPLDLTIAYRWFYFPMVGLLGIIGIGVSNIKIKSDTIQRGFYAICTIIIILLSICTIIRNADWKDGLTLFGHDIKYAKNDYFINSAYGGELLNDRQYGKAYFYLTKAISIYPNNWITWSNLGQVYEEQGNISKAKEAYTQSINRGNYATAYEQLALIHLRYDNNKTAKAFIEMARLHYPYSVKLMAALLIVQYKSGNHNGAVSSAKELYQLYPTPATFNIYLKLQKNQPLTITYHGVEPVIN